MKRCFSPLAGIRLAESDCNDNFYSDWLFRFSPLAGIRLAESLIAMYPRVGIKDVSVPLRGLG